MQKRKIQVLAVILLAAASPAFTQSKPFGLGMEPTPKNFDSSIRSATAKAGEKKPPARVDLSSLFPAPGYQGEQNSCVAWATAYAAKSYQENLADGKKRADEQRVFSPSFIYNQINNGRDQGSTIPDAIELVKSQGCATLATMPYGDYRTQPSRAAREEAAAYRVESYARLDGKNLASLKSLLADGIPVIVGMKTYENFMTYSGGVYSRTGGSYIGGHAMIIVGYDDGKNAFRIMNSWSDRWGDKGFIWYDYGLFTENHHTAMAMYNRAANTPEQSVPPNTISASAGAYKDKIVVTWENVKSAEYYLVYRSEKQPSGFRELAKTKGAACIDTQASQGVEYFYAVKSVGPGGESGFSSIARGYLLTEARLGTPKNLTGIGEKAAIKLVWDEVENAEGYYIYRWDAKAEEFRRIGVSRNTGYRDSSLSADSRGERYTVTAFRGDKESKADEGVSVLIPQVQVEIPQAPQNVAASQGKFSDRIEITWKRVPGADRYTVLRWSDRSNSYAVLARVQGTSYVDRSPLKTGLYAVSAEAGGAKSEMSEIAEGYLASVPGKPKPAKFADEDYRSDFDKRAEKFFGNEDFFSDDSFFTGPETFFRNFEEENFFLFDEEAFFKFDEKKEFQKEEDFFGDKPDGSGEDSFFK